MNPTERDVVNILVLFVNLFLKMSSFTVRERMATAYRIMFIRKLRGILLLTFIRTKVTGKMQSEPVTMQRIY